MADDTRQSSTSPAPVVEGVSLKQDASAQSFTGSQWTAPAAQPYKPSPPENANLLPGGTNNTAGGKEVDVGIMDAAKTITLEDWQKFHRKPCVRDSLLTGIVGGAGVGGLRAIWRAPVAVAANWAVGTFCVASFGMYQYCNWQRVAEKEGMKRAMELIDQKQVERKQKEARLERIRELRRQRKEEEQERQFEEARVKAGGREQGQEGGGKPFWKVW